MKKIKIISLLLIGLSVMAFIFCPLLPIVKNQINWVAALMGAFVIQNKMVLSTFTAMALIGSVFSCSEASPRNCDNCPEDELNKVVHVAFVKRGTSISTASAGAFATALLAAEAACNAIIIRNVSGTYDGSKAQKGKGAGKQVSRTLGKKHTLTFTDFDITKNVEFWNDFEPAASNYDLYFFTDTYGWKAQSSFISVEAQMPVTDNNETFIEGNIVVEWSYKKLPLPYKCTVDNLASCQELFATNLAFSNVSGSEATIVGSQVDITNGANLNIEVDTTIALDHAELTDASDALPTGLTLSTSGSTININGTPTVNGTYELIISGFNACGISSEVTVTITVSA